MQTPVTVSGREVKGRAAAPAGLRLFGVSGDVRIAPGMIYPDAPSKGDRRAHRAVSWLLKLSCLAESVRLRALLRHARIVEPSRQPGRGAEGEGAMPS